ncbi:MAG: DUF1634 domain-containing protein [Elusimicrobiaceae bacterium]|nr:DUF1634 domain-containing protein [Elusimicrobiaceae bacterium]
MKHDKAIAVLISRTLYCGVTLSAAALMAGLCAVRLWPSAGKHLLTAGLLILLLTPIARVIMLAAGYALAGRPRFAVMAGAILIIMLIGYFIGG